MRDYDFIHGLSHVSRQFTAEVWECLWKNAIVEVWDPELFFIFFEDQPEILRRIKVLMLDIRYDCGHDLNTSSALLSRYVSLSRNISISSSSLSISIVIGIE
jgi:hypothetical protein